MATDEPVAGTSFPWGGSNDAPQRFTWPTGSQPYLCCNCTCEPKPGEQVVAHRGRMWHAVCPAEPFEDGPTLSIAEQAEGTSPGWVEEWLASRSKVHRHQLAAISRENQRLDRALGLAEVVTAAGVACGLLLTIVGHPIVAAIVVTQAAVHVAVVLRLLRPRSWRH